MFKGKSVMSNFIYSEMKRFLSIFVCCCMYLCAHAKAFVVDGFKFSVMEDEYSVAVVSGAEPYSGDIVIPSEVEYNGLSYLVTQIGKSCFMNCTDLKSVVLPNSITEIGEDAFIYCI